MLKQYKSKFDKRGFTLVELSVVMALLAILSAMILTFSALMSSIASINKNQYAFAEDFARLKEELCIWVAENDTTDTVVTIKADGKLNLKLDDTNKKVRFVEGVLLLGDKRIENLESIDGISFSSHGTLIKCVTYRYDGEERTERSFVFPLRCGVISVEEVNVDD